MWELRAGVAVAVRPDLWWTAVRQLFVLAAPGWWRSPPFLPRPDRSYLRFRLQTMYGDAGTGRSGPRAADVVTYLEWCRAWPSVARAR
jgi:hypothetical protein